MIRVLVAEDMPLIASALTALLELEPDICVVGQIGRGDQLAQAVAEERPDVVVVDIDLPGQDGLTASAGLMAAVDPPRVLVLTGLGQPAHFVRALEIGVDGFLPKDSPAEDLAAAVRAVHAGERVFDPDLVRAALNTGASPLTEREAEVLAAAATGLSTQDIAREVFLAPITVRNYLSRAIAKLGARNRMDAVRIAEQAGWITSQRPGARRS
ncbi:response regulator [Geodermatophilus sp. SYSU D00700]